LKQIEKVLAFVGVAKLVFIIPLPRYVLSTCCKDTSHVSNRLSGELAAEFSGAEIILLEAAAIAERTGKARFLNILSFFGSCESLPQDLTTVDGTSIWAGDGVHLTSKASRVTARKLMADLAQGGDEGELATKQTGDSHPRSCASQKEGGGKGTADAAQSLPIAAALAIRPAAADTARAWSQLPKPLL
jgi:hypothetical protein